MSKRREKNKPQQRPAQRDAPLVKSKQDTKIETVRKEKLILEGGKFCLDIAKLVFGGVILAGIMAQDMNIALLLAVGFGVVLVFVLFGFYLISKLK